MTTFKRKEKRKKEIIDLGIQIIYQNRRKNTEKYYYTKKYFEKKKSCCRIIIFRNQI